MSSLRVYILLCALFIVDASCRVIVDDDDLLPQSVKVCKREEIDYPSCLTNAIQESWMTFMKGIPKLKIPKLDPLEVELMEDNIQTKQFTGHAILRNLKIYGLAKTKVLKVEPLVREDYISLDIDVAIPKIYMECNYKADGVADSFSISGKGYFNISMDGLSATWRLQGPVKKDRWIIEHFFVDPDIKDMKVYFSDLMNGDEDLNTAAMTLVNEYWPTFFEKMKPIIQKLSDPRLTNFVNRQIFSEVPVSKIFP